MVEHSPFGLDQDLAGSDPVDGLPSLRPIVPAPTGSLGREPSSFLASPALGASPVAYPSPALGMGGDTLVTSESSQPTVGERRG
jgi:hypothetical protein